MFAALVLAALFATGPALPPTSPLAVVTVPDEPGVVILPAAPTFQAVAADLDDDGARELVRLVGADSGSVLVEAWAESATGWRSLGVPVEVARRPPASALDVTARLLVRRVDGGDRVTLVRQTAAGAHCCLDLHDLGLANGSLAIVRRVADPGEPVGAILALDLDGDGTDELLSSRSLPPLGDISYPVDARVYRWSGDAFGEPVSTELPVGSGDTPFVLGDSDGRPGAEAAIISTLGRPGLFRIRLEPGDRLTVEDSGLVATDVRAVPIGDGRGIAVIGPTVGLAVMPWPSEGPPGEPVGELPMTEGTMLGVVDIEDEPHLLVRRTAPEALHVLGLPSLAAARGRSVTRSPAAAAFASSAIQPYVGPLPGGGLGGEPAVIYAGRFLPSDDQADAPLATPRMALTGTLAGAEPIGLVGRERAWMALLHFSSSSLWLDPQGGRLDALAAEPASSLSLVPIDVARAPERDDAILAPELDGVTPLVGGELGVPPAGFTAKLAAPPGSRVHVADVDPSVVGMTRVVPASGRIDIPIVPPVVRGSNHRYRGSMVVTTPGGHGYVATWDLRVLVMPPVLDASLASSFGSLTGRVTGRTAPYAAVTVADATVTVGPDGTFAAAVDLAPWPTEVGVTAVDPAGNEAHATVVGVGLFDYRGLPWVPIVAAFVALAALALFLRVPRSRPMETRVTDDAVLEEIEPT